MNQIHINSTGIGFMGFLFIVFFILKVLGHLTWSWWWITAPLWMPTVITIVILALFGISVFIIASIYTIFDRKK
jgi:membrane protein YdbS with pleckstrin-like domain